MLWNKFPSKSVELISKNERNQRDLIDIYAVLNFLLKDKRYVHPCKPWLQNCSAPEKFLLTDRRAQCHPIVKLYIYCAEKVAHGLDHLR